MKKLLLLFILISGFAFGQFTVTESSADWTETGKYMQGIKLYQNSDRTKAKLWYIDYNSVHDRNNGLQEHEFEFSTEPDTIDKIYDIVAQHFAEKEQEVLTLQFPEGNMYLNFFKGIGGFGFNFQFDDENDSSNKRETYGMTWKPTIKFFGKK